MLSNWRFFIAVQTPGEINGEYYALVDKNKEYTCTVLQEYPNRLYCSGPLAAIDNWVEYVIYEQETDQRVFVGEVFIPLELP